MPWNYFAEGVILPESSKEDMMIKDTLAFWKIEQSRASYYPQGYNDLVNWNVEHFDKMLKKTI